MEHIWNSVDTTEYLAFGKALLAKLYLKVKVCIDKVKVCIGKVKVCTGKVKVEVKVEVKVSY